MFSLRRVGLELIRFYETALSSAPLVAEAA